MRYRIFLLLIIILPSFGLCQNITPQLNIAKNDSFENWKKTKVKRLRHAFYYKKNGNRSKTISFITRPQDKAILMNFWKKNKTNSHLRVSLGLLEENRNSVKRLKPNLVLFAEMYTSVSYSKRTKKLVTLKLFESDIFDYIDRLEKTSGITKEDTISIEKAKNQLNSWNQIRKSKIKNKINVPRGRLKYLTFTINSTDSIFSRLEKQKASDLLIHFGIDQSVNMADSIQLKVIAHVEEVKTIMGKNESIPSPFFNFASACPHYCPDDKSSFQKTEENN